MHRVRRRLGLLAPRGWTGAALAVSLFAAAAPGIAAPDLELAWYDPDAIVDTELEAVAGEVAAIFGDLGKRVALARGSGLEAPGAKLLRVIVVKEPVAAWNLGPDVMGVTPRKGGGKSVYLIVPALREVLGGAPEEGEMALALARVLAHEVVHAVAPEHPHAAHGLMGARYQRRLLVKKRFRVDPACAAAFLDGLDAL
ncbi:MAG: hypothetical protein OEP45_02865 [Acidobacteriota bacterium]|nr:hypothetical protein [Acidobacteriota bacterium]